MESSSASSMTDTQSPGFSPTRLRGLWLVLAWVSWSALTLLSLINFVSSIMEYLSDVRTPCQAGSCVPGQPSPETTQLLHQLGFSITAYAALSVGLVSLTGLVYCATAAIIVWRKPDDWMALLTTSLLITQGLFENNYLQGLVSTPTSPWFVAGLVLSYISPVQFLFFCALFPNGRSVPRWMVWLLGVLCLIDLPPSFFPTMPLGGLINTLFVLSGFPLVAGSVIYRYHRVSTPMERQQTKWVVFGLTVVFFAFMVWFVPQIILYSSLSQPGSVYDVFGHPPFVIATLTVPICVGIAILRYRLWDIDVIINRALVYGGLTLTLAAVYFGTIIGAQMIVQALTGQTNTPSVIIVASTLLIAALFTPVRRGLQATIDQRFYRRKYDAQKTLERFGASLRTVTDLDGLTTQLVGVVEETMRPAHVSLWLHVPDQAKHVAIGDGLRSEQPRKGAQI